MFNATMFRAISLAFMATAPFAANAQSFLTTTIGADAGIIYRDYATNNVPGSGVWNPRKSEIRRWGSTIGNAFSQAMAGAAAGAIGKTTRAQLYADLAHAADKVGNVFADPVSANNGIYLKTGISGSGAWTQVTSNMYGLLPNITIGTVTTVAANIPAAVSFSGSAAAPVLDFSIPQGVAGSPLAWRGLWSGVTAYVAGDLVYSNNNLYVAAASSTNQAPPNITYWTLAFSLTGSATSPETIYVSGGAANGIPAGNDTSGTGTQSAPYATIEKAVTVASSGQRIRCNDGTYTIASGVVQITQSLTIDSITPLGCVIRPAAAQNAIFNLNPSGAAVITFGEVTLDANSASNGLVTIADTATVFSVNMLGTKLQNYNQYAVNEGSAGRFNFYAEDANCVSTTGSTCFRFLSHLQGNLEFYGQLATVTQSVAGYTGGVVVDVDADAAGPTFSFTGPFVLNWIGGPSAAIYRAIQVNDIPNAIVGCGEENATRTCGIINALNRPAVATSCRSVQISNSTSGTAYDSSGGKIYGTAFTQDCTGGGHGGATIGFDGNPDVEYTITAVTGTASPYTVTATGIPAMSNGAQVQLTGMTPATLDGIYTVTSSASGSFTATTSSTGTWSANGNATPLIYSNLTNNAKIFNNTFSQGAAVAALAGTVLVEGGPFCGWQTGCQMYRNKVDGSGYGLLLKGTTSAFVYSNVTTRIYKNHMAIKVGRNNTFANNTNYETADLGTTQQCFVSLSELGVPAVNTIVKNNICSMSLGTPNNFRFASAVVTGAVHSATFSNNNWYNAGGLATSFPWVWNGSTYANLAAWQGAQEASATSLVPGYQNESAGFIGLAGSSGLVSAGAALSTPVLADYVQAPFVSVPSVGAYQYSGPSLAGVPILAATNTWAGVNIFPAGSAAAPPVSFSTDNNTGFFSAGTGIWDFSSAGSARIRLRSSQLQLGSALQMCWSSAATVGTCDTLLTRAAAANIRQGDPDAAAPVAQTSSVQSVVAGTSNTAGATRTITGSRGTGTGNGGNIVLQVAPPGGSGTAQNALVTALTLDGATGNAVVARSLVGTAALPTISACGTSPPAATTGSTNNAGKFTLGTGTPTACTVTLANAFPNAAFCTLTRASNYTGTYYISAQSAGAFTVTLGTGTDSVAFHYHCNGS